MFTSYHDEENGIIAVAVQHMNMAKELAGSIQVMFCIFCLFFLIAMIYIVISSEKITKPITKLKEIMEHTQWNNISEEYVQADTEIASVAEIEVLYDSYFKVLHRLSDSIEKEKKLSVLQMEAQFDLLQAQVNPHFIYNTLNVIAAKGMMANDESICEICSALSGMLRYSTNTNEKMATVREEVEYLQKYLSLMKYRYEHRLEYAIQIAPEIESEMMPKVTLEQIVENAFQHGGADKREVISIVVIGDGYPGNWYIHVRDNGSGFTQEKIEELQSKFEKVKAQLSQNREHIEMKLGGMGLVSVYARMYLVYGDRMIFLIHSGEEGAEVTIGVCDEKED